MEVVARGRHDAERLLHQAVRFVSVAIRSLVLRLLQIRIVPSAILRRPPTVGASGHGRWWRRRRKDRALAASTLTFHLSIGQEAAGDPTGTPRFPIGPPSHAGLPFIPHKDRSGLNRLPLLFRQSSLDSREQAETACLEQDDCICGCPHVACIGLHVSLDGVAAPSLFPFFFSRGSCSYRCPRMIVLQKRVSRGEALIFRRFFADVGRIERRRIRALEI